MMAKIILAGVILMVGLMVSTVSLAAINPYDQQAAVTTAEKIYDAMLDEGVPQDV
ncbi:hypothetical protein [Photorhabdus sp. CRCIA-P01]|uniref:hypothetical protein n=1 Tax=Photorhabdus sp. CRCIA-P01 TaxID=2019570 RepID=UPI0013004AB8|nr:hypothetical protein [Photorhabdus sp. CRCIA-P01]